MATPAPPLWTQADLAAVCAAIAAPMLSVQFADRKIVYADMDSLIRARNMIEAYLNGQNGIKPRRQIQIYTNKGWG